MSDQNQPPDDRFTPGQRIVIKSGLVFLLLSAEMAFGLLNMFLGRAFFGPDFFTGIGPFVLVGFMVGMRLFGPSPRSYDQPRTQRLNGAAIRGICALAAALIMSHYYP